MILILIWYVFTDNSFDHYTLTMLKLCIAGVILMVVVDNLNVWYETLSELKWHRWLACVFFYVIRGVLPYSVFAIVWYRSHHQRNPKNMIWLIPAFINLFFCATSYWTHWIWWYDATNVFHRGPLNFLPFAVCGFYMIVLIQWSLMLLGSNKTESVVLFIIVFSNVLSAVLETVYGYRLLIIKSVSISVFMYYLFLYTQVYNRDALTDVFNRRRFYLDAKSMQHSYFSVVSMDMNGLKQINDTWGHHAGDQALITCCKCMKGSLPPKTKLYRIGGDEFVVLAPRMTKSQINPAIQSMQNSLKQAGYTVACGIAEYTPGDDFEKVLTHSDQRMYQAKAMMKARESLENSRKTPSFSDSLNTTVGRITK